jgi:hypothetical protein
LKKMKQLNFAEEYHYQDDDEGIPLRVMLRYGDQAVRVTAIVDTGSAVCLFSQEAGLALGVPIEQGIPNRLGSLTGSLEAFGHEVILQTGDIALQTM